MGGGFDPRSAAKVVKDDALEENVKKAAEEVIKKQVELGIDVITDGEVERGKISSIFNRAGQRQFENFRIYSLFQ